MAYWAGNAFHITMTMRMVDGYLSGKSDAMQTCGAGIAIKNNYFGHNIGLKRHNGGVGVIRCGHSVETESSAFTYRSGKHRKVYRDIVVNA